MKQAEAKAEPSWRPPEGKGTWQRSDGAAMLAAYLASGLSMSKFASQHGVGVHRIWYWRDKLQSESGRGASRGFSPIAIREAPAATAAVDAKRSVEAVLRGGRSLFFRGDWDAATIGCWLAALEESA